MQPTTIDFLTPFDPTGYPTISGAQLLQLIGGLYPNIGIGLNLITADIAGVPTVPNANSVTKWQNYTWIRQSSTFVTAYVWNPGGASDATFLNWVPFSNASIGAGTIQGYQIANQTITSANILSISSSLITGSVVPTWLASLNVGNTAYATNGLLTTSMPLFGDLTGSTLGIPTISAAAITLAKMAKQSVSGNSTAGQGNIIDNSIYTLQLLSTGAAASTSLNNPAGAVDPANNIIVPSTSIVGIPGAGSSTQAVAAGDIIAVAYGRQGYKTVNRAILNLADPTSQTYVQVPIVAANGTIYSMAQPSVIGARLLQRVIGNSTTKTTSSGNVSTGSTPNYNGTGVTAFFSVNFTPLSASSTIFVRASLHLYAGSNAYLYGGVYPNNGATAPTAFSVFGAASGQLPKLNMDGSLASTGTTPMTFYVGFGCTAGSAFTNSADGSTTIFGGLVSTLIIDEYL